MRMGGLDGVAMQKKEYRQLLNSIDISVHAVTGLLEKEFDTPDPIGHKESIIPELDFYHENSLILFANQFTEGVEKEGIEEISDDEWHILLDSHRKIIRDAIDEVLQKTPNNTPVIIYNLISLRHAQPAAALAIKELIEKYPNRGFLSHAADPDAERPEKIRRIKKHCLPALSCNPEEEPYSGGPYHANNLYHIVLNPVQKENFINKYKIPEDHVFEIPDFMGFESDTPKLFSEPKGIFLDFLSDQNVLPDGGSYRYGHDISDNKSLDENSVFFLSPVRPVYRKQLKEAMVTAKQYELSRSKKVAFVVTHPNIDDQQYFQETVEFAKELELDYYHLGERFTLQTLDYVYENMAPMNTIGLVASNAGGWENALNEMAHSCIPFFMNSLLNSYIPITEKIGIKTFGTDFSSIQSIMTNYTVEQIKTENLVNDTDITELFAWIDSVLNKTERDKLIRHNYAMAYKWLSQKATAPRLMEAILYIYSRHGLPGEPGQAVLP